MAMKLRYNPYARPGGYAGGKSVGGGAFLRGAAATKIASQAQVTYNGNVDNNLFSTRQEAAARYPADAIIGPVVNPAQMMVLEGSLMFSRRDEMTHRATLRSTGPQDRKPTVFASFTGVRIPNHVTDDESLASTVVFMGVSVNQYSHDDKYQTQDGVAMALTGSISIDNNGRFPVFPGQALMWRTPSIDPKRRSQDAVNTTLPGDRAIVEPYTFDQRVNWPGASLDWLMHSATDNDVAFLGMDLPDNAGNIPRMPLKKRIAVGLSETVIQSGLSVLAVLEAYGLVSLTVPDAWQDPQVYARVLRGIADNPVDSLHNKRLSWGPNGDVVVEAVSDAQMINTRNKRLMDTGFLMALMGYGNTRISQSLRPSLNMVRAVVGRALWNLLPSGSDRQTYDVVPYYGNRGLRRDIDSASMRLLDTLLAALKKARADAPTDFLRAVALNFHMTRDRLFATSMYFSAPKTKLDVVLSS